MHVFYTHCLLKYFSFVKISESTAGSSSSSLSRVGMAKTMWTVHENNETFENNNTIDSVPVPDSNFSIPRLFRNYNPLRLINNVTGSAVILKRIQAGYAQESLERLGTKDEKLTTPERVPLGQTIKTLDSRYGVYIPMQKLKNRVKRQVNNLETTNSTLQKGRILVLMNPNETSIDQSMFKRNVLMLVKQPEEPKPVESILPSIPNLLSIDNVTNVQEILQLYQFKPLMQTLELREVLQSQPAIQRVNLDNIELAFPDNRSVGNKTVPASSENGAAIQLQIKRLLEILVAQTRPKVNSSPPTTSKPVQQVRRVPNRRTPTVTAVQGQTVLNNQRSSSSSPVSGNPVSTRQETRRGSGNSLVNFRHSSASRVQGGNVLNTPATSRTNTRVAQRSNVRTQPVNNNLLVQIRRQGQSLPRGAESGSRGRSEVRPLLSRQANVNMQRIQTSPTARQRSGTRSRGGRPLVRAVSSRNLRQGATRSTRTDGSRSSDVTQRHTPVIRAPVRRQFVQLRRPSDPFTQRFSAGFQRGSSLLHQPPLNVTGFDGTVREQTNGFNTFNPFPAPFATGPALTGLPGVPQVFGGGIPNMFLGPTIL